METGEVATQGLDMNEMFFKDVVEIGLLLTEGWGCKSAKQWPTVKAFLETCFEKEE